MEEWLYFILCLIQQHIQLASLSVCTTFPVPASHNKVIIIIRLSVEEKIDDGGRSWIFIQLRSETPLRAFVDCQ